MARPTASELLYWFDLTRPGQPMGSKRHSPTKGLATGRSSREWAIQTAQACRYGNQHNTATEEFLSRTTVADARVLGFAPDTHVVSGANFSANTQPPAHAANSAPEGG